VYVTPKVFDLGSTAEASVSSIAVYPKAILIGPGVT